MKVIGADVLEKFAKKHERAENPLRKWRVAVTQAEWKHSADIKKTFRTADVVGSQTVFDIGGNKYRLIARVNYRLQIVLVQDVLTHAAYNKEGWKE